MESCARIKLNLNEGDSGGWSLCKACHEPYEPHVGLALSWSAWRSVVSRPLHSKTRLPFMMQLANVLGVNGQHNEATRIARETRASAQRYAPDDDELAFSIDVGLASTLYFNPSSSRADLREAEALCARRPLPELECPEIGYDSEMSNQGLATLLRMVRERLAEL